MTPDPAPNADAALLAFGRWALTSLSLLAGLEPGTVAATRPHDGRGPGIARRPGGFSADDRGATIDIEPLERRHWPRVREIYAEGIATGQATFETSVPGWEAWDEAHLACCRFVAKLDGKVVGWAALSPYSSRCVYEGVAEASVYVAAARRGEGVGSALMDALIAASEEEGIWTLQGGVFPENQASRALCRKKGFREVGVRERLGELDGEWRDVVLLERRSPKVGSE